MSDEAWLIGRKVDVSKKIFVATGIVVFDFELFICGRVKCHEYQPIFGKRVSEISCFAVVPSCLDKYRRFDFNVFDRQLSQHSCQKGPEVHQFAENPIS